MTPPRRATGEWTYPEPSIPPPIASKFASWAAGVITVAALSLGAMAIRHEVNIAKLETSRDYDSRMLHEVSRDVKHLLALHGVKPDEKKADDQ
jgi:hypothetical protein